MLIKGKVNRGLKTSPKIKHIGQLTTKIKRLKKKWHWASNHIDNIKEKNKNYPNKDI